MTNQSKKYFPCHPITKNYICGMKAINEGRLIDAINILSQEPTDSPCITLAKGNTAQTLLRLERLQEAEQVGREAVKLCIAKGCPHPPSFVQFIRNLGECISTQGRREESLSIFNDSRNIADELIGLFPDMQAHIELQKAHALNSWGTALLQLESFSEAIELFQAARVIHEKYIDSNTIGYAEVLTNLALTLNRKGERTRGALALEEAMNVARQLGHIDQCRRIIIANIQSGYEAVENVLEFIENAADEAAKEGRYSTAYLRYCIYASEAKKRGEFDKGLKIISKAKEIENTIDKNDINLPKLRFTQARLMELSHSNVDDIIKVLIQGAFLWYERISSPIMSNDIHSLCKSLHDHFRLLSRMLLDRKRLDEALLAFESGRAIGHSIEVDRDYIKNNIYKNPFEADGSKISTIILDGAKKALVPGNTSVVLAILPPQIVAFIINRRHVDYVAVNLPISSDGIDYLYSELDNIPIRLGNNVGKRAIPELIGEISRLVTIRIGDNVITSFTPYSKLHLVPWRAVLISSGLSWKQVSFSLNFSFLFRKFENIMSIHGKKVIALGYGVSNDIDFADEAKSFISPFGDNGILKDCTSKDLGVALNSDAIVMLSCHGRVIEPFGDVQLTLCLNDGNFYADEIFPNSVRAPVVILSACDSGVYNMYFSDYPVGAAPLLIRRGTIYCIGARFPIDAMFAARFFRELATYLSANTDICNAFSLALEKSSVNGANFWRDLACLELIGG